MVNRLSIDYHGSMCFVVGSSVDVEDHISLEFPAVGEVHCPPF